MTWPRVDGLRTVELGADEQADQILVLREQEPASIVGLQLNTNRNHHQQVHNLQRSRNHLILCRIRDSHSNRKYDCRIDDGRHD